MDFSNIIFIILYEISNIYPVVGYILCHCNTIECQAVGTSQCKAEFYCFRVFKLNHTNSHSTVIRSHGCVAGDYLDMCTRRNTNSWLTDCCRDNWCNADPPNGTLLFSNRKRSDLSTHYPQESDRNNADKQTGYVFKTPTIIATGIVILIVLIGIIFSTIMCFCHQRTKARCLHHCQSKAMQCPTTFVTAVPCSSAIKTSICEETVKSDLDSQANQVKACFPEKQIQTDPGHIGVNYEQNSSGSPYFSGTISNVQTYDEPWTIESSQKDLAQLMMHQSKPLTISQKTSMWIRRQQELTRDTPQLSLDTQPDRSHSSQPNDVTDSSEISGRISSNAKERIISRIMRIGEPNFVKMHNANSSQRSHETNASSEACSDYLSYPGIQNVFHKRSDRLDHRNDQLQKLPLKEIGLGNGLIRSSLETDSEDWKAVRIIKDKCKNETLSNTERPFTVLTNFRRANDQIELATPYAQIDISKDKFKR